VGIAGNRLAAVTTENENNIYEYKFKCRSPVKKDG
jgi:hypothetical protein